MASGIYAEVKKRIELAEPGTVFLTSDFTDIVLSFLRQKEWPWLLHPHKN